MHIGNVYAMLGAWLSARAGGPERTSRTGGGAGDADCLNNVNRVDGMSGAADPGDADGGRGRMLLRIEDIDTPRVLPDADRWIMDDLAWLGLDWDGEPVYQSRRLDIYEQALRALQGIDLRDAAAFGGRDGVDGTETTALIYPCFCSRADIRAASAPQEGDRFVMYPGTCRSPSIHDRSSNAWRMVIGIRCASPCLSPATHVPWSPCMIACSGTADSICRAIWVIRWCDGRMVCSPISWLSRLTTC